jgi:hypothetical protein
VRGGSGIHVSLGRVRSMSAPRLSRTLARGLVVAWLVAGGLVRCQSRIVPVMAAAGSRSAVQRRGRCSSSAVPAGCRCPARHES